MGYGIVGIIIFILGLFFVLGILQIAIMAPRWANNILKELKLLNQKLQKLIEKDKSP